MPKGGKISRQKKEGRRCDDGGRREGPNVSGPSLPDSEVKPVGKTKEEGDSEGGGGMAAKRDLSGSVVTGRKKNVQKSGKGMKKRQVKKNPGENNAGVDILRERMTVTLF